jgi:carbon-monoxide dehydrogenase iron sulfur subunit
VTEVKTIVINVDKCLACKSCEIACAVEHSKSKNLIEALREDPPPISRISVREVNHKCVAIMCHQCEDAPCINACIAGGMHKEDGIVVADPERCVGCWSCIMVCPYGSVIQDERNRIALKCDLCKGRKIPACVEACPTGALELVDRPVEAKLGSEVEQIDELTAES